MTEATAIILNKNGMHARPASLFVQKASSFKSDIQIKAKGKSVDAKSILMLMSMGLTAGTEITIVADGPDEREAVIELKTLIDSDFCREFAPARRAIDESEVPAHVMERIRANR